MEIRCLIVDDEPPAVDELAFILSDLDKVILVGTAGNAARATRAIKSLQPHLVFLDVQMPGRNGFDVMRPFAAPCALPLFVLATAYDEHAVAAFEANAIDYLLKPFAPARVSRSVERARQILLGRSQEPLSRQVEQLVACIGAPQKALTKISVESKGRIRLLDPREIVFCKAENKGVTVFTQAEGYALHGFASLEALEDKLQNHAFFRAHRRYLVNLAHVQEIAPWFNGRYVLITVAPRVAEVPVSRSRVKSLKTCLGI
jgi:two-component system LytT family response regulator/two-component system response regulator LytT